MQPYICGRFADQYLITGRTGGHGAKISEEKYLKLATLAENKVAEVPEWLSSTLSKLGATSINKTTISDLVLIRKQGTVDFVKASYEITEMCNFRCQHCYLGEKREGQLTLEDKKRVFDLIERAGCLWLQITGGEPLVDCDFVKLYTYAQSLGFLVTLSTNGPLLLSPQITQVLKEYPPWRLTVSLYGATDDSYESLTKTCHSASMVYGGLAWAKTNGLRVRINIIVTKYNKNEISRMVEFARECGFNYHVFDQISPTVDGNRMPLEVMSMGNCLEDKQFSVEKDSYMRNTPCRAGKTFFHVGAMGAMSVCKISRQSSINLLSTGVDGFSQLSSITDKVLTMPVECQICKDKQKCTTCAPILALYKIGGKIPAFICRKCE